MDYDGIIHGLLTRSRTLLQADPRMVDHWQFHLLPEWAATALCHSDPHEFIAFIREHKAYCFAYYDAFGKVCGKPREIAAYVLTELIKELVEEQQG